MPVRPLPLKVIASSLALALLLGACGKKPPAPPASEPVPPPAAVIVDPGTPALEPLPPLDQLSTTRDWPGAASVEARLERLERLEDETDLEVIRDILQLALADADVSVRREALNHIERLSNTKAAPLLARLLSIEPVAEIRYRALDIIGQWKGPEAVPVLAVALSGPNKDSKLIAISQLALREEKPALATLFQGLSDPDEHVRDVTNDKIEFLIDRRFNTHADAAAWWNTHSSEHDAQLFRKE